MLDIHSHFLPKMDDGAKTVEMSLEMLRLSKAQGVDTIVSTSHFYADSEAPDSFLKRRAHAFKKIEPLLSPAHPSTILFGAEVYYFPGLSASEEVAKLIVEGTDLILIEMPFEKWPTKIFQELHTFQSRFGLKVVLVHVERYLPIQKKAVFAEMLEHEFLIQCNAGAFVDRKTRKFALNLLKTGRLNFLGTDCHNLDTRKPNMGEAREIIEKKLGADAWRTFCEESEALLRSHLNAG